LTQTMDQSFLFNGQAVPSKVAKRGANPGASVKSKPSSVMVPKIKNKPKQKRAQAMPGNPGEIDDSVPQEELWNQVDDFLSTPGPSLDTIAKSKAPKSQLPDLRRERSSIRMSSGVVKASSKTTQHNNSYVQLKTKQAQATASKIDPDLLAEAFEYCDQLKQNVDLSQQVYIGPNVSEPTRQNVGQAKQKHSKPTARSRHAKATTKTEIVVKKKKGQRSRSACGYNKRKDGKRRGNAGQIRESLTAREFDCSTSKHSDIDYEALIKNFKQGTTLQALRNQLAASQKSQTQSFQAMKALVTDVG